MHYKNGREAKIGDRVIGKDVYGKVLAGILIEVVPGTDTCNGYVVPDETRLVSLKDCLHIENI